MKIGDDLDVNGKVWEKWGNCANLKIVGKMKEKKLLKYN